MKKKTHITVTGLSCFFGTRPLEENGYILLTKDPANPFDSEAIFAESLYWGRIGYVANHPGTRLRGTISAGRLYDRIPKRAIARIRFIADDCAICVLAGKKKTKKLLHKFNKKQAKFEELHDFLELPSLPGALVIRILAAEANAYETPEENSRRWY